MNNQIIKIQKTSKNKILSMTNKYYEYLTAPMDDMWEIGIIGKSNYYNVIFGDRKIGYFCLDNNNVLLQYFITDLFLDQSKEIFKYIISKHKIKEAFVSTIEPRYLSLCLDFQKKMDVDTILYTDSLDSNIKNPIKTAKFYLATMEELQDILNYQLNKVSLEGDWIEPYYIDIIKKEQLYLLKLEDEIIGSGELRPCLMNNTYANLGVTVSKKYRRQGLGSYILSYLKKLCYKQNLVPICSTSINNIGSQKSIENAGLFAYNRVMKVYFNDLI